MARVAEDGHNRLGTTNGTVRLTLPRDASANVEAGTVNGSAHCDFDLDEGARVSRRKVEGRIGRGGARFELRTVNGSASIDRGSPPPRPAGRTRPTPRKPYRPEHASRPLFGGRPTTVGE